MLTSSTMSVGLDSNSPGERYCPTCEKTFPIGERCPADGTRLVRLASSEDQLLGRELDGRYTIVQALGAGGMGTVYRGTQHSVGRDVAIKVVLPKHVSEPAMVKRFLREAKLASKLLHPNVVAMLDFGQTDDGVFYLVMELCTGRTLDAVLEIDKSLPPERVVRIGIQICDALESAHVMQIVHRDLTPANVMLSADDHVKVLDFGLAKSLTPNTKATMVTNEGQLLGTPAFMPPELITGAVCDGRADLYSLGCVLYNAVSGRMPFVGATSHEIIAMQIAEPPKPLTGVPAGLAAVIERLMAKDPDHRYQTAVQAREALEDSLSEGAAAAAVEPTMISSSNRTMLGWDGITGKPSMPAPVAVPRTVIAPPAARRADTEPPAPAKRSSLPLVMVLLVLVAIVAAIVVAATR